LDGRGGGDWSKGEARGGDDWMRGGGEGGRPLDGGEETEES
jgi:hypothetical protein